MRVFYLDDIPTPYRLGVFKALAGKLGENFKVGFCAGEEPGRNWNLNFSGINYKVLDGFQWRPPFQINPFSFKINFSIIRALSEFKPDMFIVSGYTHPTVFIAITYCRLKKIPFSVVSETNEHCSSTSGLKWLIKKMIVSPIVRKMSFGLPCGSQAESYFRLLGVKPDVPCFYFPNTPDTTPIKNTCLELTESDSCENILTKYGVKPKEVTILFVGRLIGAKNPMELIQAYDNLSKSEKSNTNLIIVGAGDLEGEIKKYAEEYENINHIPWLSEPKDVYELMCLADIFVLPSVHEPWGAVVNEAMAAGCCTVTTQKVGAAHDMIENGRSGMIYESGNVTMLQKALSEIISNPSLRSSMSEEAKISADKFSQNYAASNLLKGLEYVENK